MAGETPSLSVRLLGTPEIHLAGASFTLNHLKARALLFYLAATGQPNTRDYLATLLWSEAGSREAHHSLRSSLYRLRRAMRPQYAEAVLRVDGELLSLRPGVYECDVIEFRHLCATGDEAALAQAVNLYRGPFLQGFTLADAPVFDEWVRSEEMHLSQECFHALDRLSSWAEARQEWATAIRYTQQMAQIDPLSETAGQRLMHLYVRQGEAGLAVRQYRQFESRLWQELSLTPSPETQALLQEALRQQRSPKTARTGPVRAASRPAYTLPFTGRELLLQQLSAIRQEVQAGHSTTVLLQGEAGIGKSRLLDEFASRLIAESPGWIILQGACSPFDDLLSHGPFLEALQDAMTGEAAGMPAEPDAGIPDARGRFSWRVLQAIRWLARSMPLLFIIEDLQWANSSTLNLFGFLSMRIHHLPVMLVGTVQHVEAIPALQRLIALGRRRGELHLIVLTPLTLKAVAGLLHTSGVSLSSVETLAEWLHARSAGNPFLLSEILAQLRAETMLKPAGDGWHLDTPRWLRWRTTFTLPETTHDLVAWRLADLAPDARRFLDVLAIAGQPLPVSLLRDISGVQADSFVTLVDDLTARGLVIEPPDSRLALAHHLLRETLLFRMSNLRRRNVHQQLAQALETHTSLEDGASLRKIALHAVAGEDIDRARRYGLRVLPDLPQEYTGAETIDFVQHLYDLLAPSASASEMVRLTRALGALHQSLGHLEVAAHWQQQDLGWAQKTGDRVAQAGAWFQMGELALMTHNYHAAANAAQEGLAVLEADEMILQSSTFLKPSLIGRGHRLLGAALAMEGSDLPAAEYQLQQAVAAHQRAENQGDLCAAFFELGNIAAQRGEIARALDFYDKSAHAAEAGHIHYYHALARNNFAYHSLLLGQIGAAQQSVALGIKVAEAHDLLAALLHLYSTQGEIHLYLAEWAEAGESFQRGLALAEDLGSLERQAGYRGGLALAARGRNEHEAAGRLLQEALALIAEQGYWHLRTRLQLWLAETQVEGGSLTQAALLLDEAIATARAHQRKLLLVQGERLRARLLAMSGDWPAANALFAEILERASGLGLPLEIARVQAAWGMAALRYSPAPNEGRALIAEARAILAAYNARADLAGLH
jgi:DNA-binding SARP family transcriptional activator/tetratricopeptide (TPR) repeat protein